MSFDHCGKAESRQSLPARTDQFRQTINCNRHTMQNIIGNHHNQHKACAAHDNSKNKRCRGCQGLGGVGFNVTVSPQYKCNMHFLLTRKNKEEAPLCVFIVFELTVNSIMVKFSKTERS